MMLLTAWLEALHYVAVATDDRTSPAETTLGAEMLA